MYLSAIGCWVEAPHGGVWQGMKVELIRSIFRKIWGIITSFQQTFSVLIITFYILIYFFFLIFAFFFFFSFFFLLDSGCILKYWIPFSSSFLYLLPLDASFTQIFLILHLNLTYSKRYSTGLQAENPGVFTLESALWANSSVYASVGAIVCSSVLLKILEVIRVYGKCNGFQTEHCAVVHSAGAELVDTICGPCLESQSDPLCSPFECPCNAHYCSKLTRVCCGAEVSVSSKTHEPLLVWCIKGM